MGDEKHQGDSQARFMGSTAPALFDACTLIRRLSARLLESTSATGVLLAWCEQYGLSSGPISVVHKAHVPAVDEEVLARLRSFERETIRYRCVQLVRGNLALAEAENWYVRHRLPQKMQHVLESTEAPFGVVVQPLRPSRHTFRVCLTPVNSNRNQGEPLTVERADQGLPRIILEHDAVIMNRDGNPLAVVKERFRSELLTFALPGRPESL